MLDNRRTPNKQSHLHDAITRSAIIAHYLDEYLQTYVSCDNTAYKAVHGKVVRIFDRNKEALDFFIQLDNYLQSPPYEHPNWLKEKIKFAKKENPPQVAIPNEKNPPDTKIRKEANALISEGFQLIRIAKNRKVPYKGSKGVHGRYATQDFKSGDNIAIRTGTENNGYYLTVVDIDISQKSNNPKEAKVAYDIEKLLTTRFGETVKVETGGNHRGTHFYYLSAEKLDTYKQVYTPFKDSFGKTKKIELIATENKYVLAPGSKVERMYQSNKELRIENISTTSAKEIEHQLTTINSLWKDHETPTTTNQTATKQKKHSHKTGKTPKHKRTREKPSKTPPSLKQVQPRSKNIDNLGCKRHKTQEASQESKVLCDTRLTTSESLWIHLLSEHAKRVYPGSLWQYKGLGKSFRCVIHKEKKPSAALYKRKDGSIVYHDFHDGKSFDIIEYFAYLNSDVDSVPITSDKQFLSYWSTELKKYIRENGIDTGFSRPLRDYHASLDLSFMKPRFRHVLNAITDIAYMKIDIGDNYFLASKRYIARMTGLPDDAVNRTMNQLVFLGFLRKGEDRATKRGITYRYYLQTPSQAHITERYNLLRENNLVSYRNFKRDTVFEVFGAEIADMIFRRNANDETNTEDTAQDMTQEDTDRIMVDLSDVSPGYGTETLPEQVNTGRIIGDFDNFGDTGGGTP